MSKEMFYLEIRSAVGGDDACIFASELLGMYIKYARKES
jgi:protein subunit release factor A